MVQRLRLLLTLAGALASPAVRAEVDGDFQGAGEQPAVITRVAAGPEVWLGDFCETDLDLIQCQELVPFVAFDLQVVARAGRAINVGGFVEYDMEPGSGRFEVNSTATGQAARTQFTRRGFSLGVEVMHQGTPNAGLWLAATLGVALVQDTARPAPPSEAETVSQWGAVVGGNLGYEVDLGDSISLGPEGRLQLRHFPERAPQGTVDYGFGANVYAGVNLAIGF